MNSFAELTTKLNCRSTAEELVSGGPSVVESLIWALQHDGSTVHRRYAAYVLGKIRDGRAVEPLALTLRRDEPLVRENAAEALGHIGDPRGVRPLLHALGDATAVVRRYAERALVKIGPAAVMPLIQELWDPRAGVHDGVLNALTRIGPPALLPLLHTIRYGDGTTRQDATDTLNHIGNAHTLPRKVLTDTRLTGPQKAEILEILLPYFGLPETLLYCKIMAYGENEALRDGAESVLREFDRRILVRPCLERDKIELRYLLHPASPALPGDPPEMLLRALHNLPQPEEAPKRRRLLSRLRRPR